MTNFDEESSSMMKEYKGNPCNYSRDYTEKRSPWSECPNCGGIMKLDDGMHPRGFNDIQPTYDMVNKRYVWSHYWVCNKCWTKVERVVRVVG